MMHPNPDLLAQPGTIHGQNLGPCHRQWPPGGGVQALLCI